MPDFEAQIKATLDSSDAESKINSFVSKKYGPINIDVNLNMSKSSQNIANLINQFKQQGQSAASSFAASFNNSLGKLDVSKFTGSLNDLKNRLGNLGFNTAEIDNITNKLDQMKVSVQSVSTAMNSKGGLDIRIKGVDELGRAVTMTEKFSQSSGKLVSSVNAVAKAEQQISTGKLETASNQFETWAKKNTESLKGYEQELENFRNRMDAMKTGGASASAFKGWEEDLKVFQSQIKDAQATVQQFVSMDTINTQNNNFTAWLNSNGKAVKAYAQEIEKLKQDMQGMQNGQTTPQQLKQWESSVALLQSKAKAEGNDGMTFGQEISAAFGSASKFAASYMSIYKVISTVKEGMQTIVGLDDALVDLQKTTTASFDELDSFYREANDIAKQYGTTTQQVIQGAAD